MPKLKTKSSIKKRFSRTGKGKIKFKPSGKKHGMIGLDESLFNLWRNGSVLEQDVLEKAHKVKELQEKITQAKQGIFTDDEDEDVFEDEDEEGGSEES